MQDQSSEGKIKRVPAHLRDANQIAHNAVQQLTASADGKNPAAVALGRLGGLKGGKARSKALSPEERSAIARKGALAFWKKRGKKAKARP
jgi:hypothetical protein